MNNTMNTDPRRAGVLTGKSVAITGGAGGIGRAIAEVLTRGGANVAIGDLNAQPNPTAPGLSLAVDVTDPVSMQEFLAQAEQAHGPLDILILSAGIMWVGPSSEEPPEVARAQIDVNLLGVIHGVQAGAARMKGRGGHIMTIASAASLLGPPGEATYAATKHGVYGYLKAVREELRGSGIEVSAIMPGVVDTDLAVGTATGAARLLTPDDVARAVVRTIARPRLEVTVPAFIWPLSRIVNLLPAPLRDVMHRLMVPNQVRKVDPNARRDYESRFTR